MEGNYKSRQQNNDCAQSAMNLLSVQWSCLERGVSKYRTGDGEYALFIITKGSGSITVDGKEYEVSQGKALAVFPETEVKTAGAGQSLFYCIRLCSCGSQVQECAEEAGFSREFSVRDVHVNCMTKLKKTVKCMLESDTAGYVEQLEQNCRMTKVWIDLIEDHKTFRGQMECAVTNARGRAAEIQEIAVYMKAHMEENLKIEQIAREYGMNRSGLTRQFRSIMGCPPQQYLLQVRIERAKELLRNTEETIGEIAARVGYRDALAFSHIFKEKCKVGPREYRKGCAEK